MHLRMHSNFKSNLYISYISTSFRQGLAAPVRTTITFHVEKSKRNNSCQKEMGKFSKRIL